MKNTRYQRRKLLKWSVPVVTSVALPAHAQASLTQCENAVPTINITVNSISPSSGTLNQGEIIRINASYSITNVSPDFSFRSLNIDADISYGPPNIGGIGTPNIDLINAPLSGTVEFQLIAWPANSTNPTTALSSRVIIQGSIDCGVNSIVSFREFIDTPVNFVFV